MSSVYEFELQLDALEHAIKQCGVWPTVKPSQLALASQQPFAVDTMDFVSWLVFIFLKKCRALVAQKQLPPPMAVAPAAQVALSSCEKAIIEILTSLDTLTHGLSPTTGKE